MVFSTLNIIVSLLFAIVGGTRIGGVFGESGINFIGRQVNFRHMYIVFFYGRFCLLRCFSSNFAIIDITCGTSQYVGRYHIRGQCFLCGRRYATISFSIFIAGYGVFKGPALFGPYPIDQLRGISMFAIFAGFLVLFGVRGGADLSWICLCCAGNLFLGLFGGMS